MPDQNPFAYMLPTPEGLNARRKAEFAQSPGSQDFWTNAAGQSGLDLRNSLVSQGFGLSPEDKRAFQTQQIMGRAQSMLSELVKNGELDPLDAQEEVIKRTMGDFMSVGDYQAAQALLPGLNQIRTYKGELGKLRSETVENQASAFKSTAEGQAKLAVTPSEILKNQTEGEENLAQAGQANAAAYMNTEHGKLYARTDPNIRAGKGGGAGGAGLSQNEAAKVRQQGLGALNLFDAVGELSTYMASAPVVASQTAAGVNVGSQWLSGFKNLLASKGASVPGGASGLSTNSADGADGMSPRAIVATHQKEIAATAVKLGFKDITAFESLVIDAAYALARANDPGGRLSNNDFTFALQALGAVQDQKSALKAFKQLADRGLSKFENTKKLYKPDVWDAEFSDMDKEVHDSYNKFAGVWGGSDVKAVEKQTAEEKRKADLRSRYINPQGQ